MNTLRTRVFLAVTLVMLLGAAVPESTFASSGKGKSQTSSTAATPSRSGGGGSGRSSSRTSPGRHWGPSGGLVGTHYRPVHRNYYYDPWWSFGLGWGWPGFSYWGSYGAWYPGYGYPGYPSYGYARNTLDDLSAAEIHISPRKSTVRLDGNEVGQARDFNSSYEALLLQPGEHMLEFSYPGYKTLKVRVSGQEGQLVTLRFDLEKGEGVDSRSETAEIKPPPADASAPSAPSAPGTEPPPASGTLRTGMMRIHVEPYDAAVYLDGEFLGTADELSRLHGALSVATGDHRVEAVRPGYVTRSATVTVGDAEPASVKLFLEAAPKN